MQKEKKMLDYFYLHFSKNYYIMICREKEKKKC